MLAPPAPPALRPWSFILLAFAFTWAFAGFFWLVDPMAAKGSPSTATMVTSYVAVWGPSLAGLVLAWRTGGREGAWRLLRRLWKWPGTLWLALAAAIPLGAEFVGALIGWAIGPYSFEALSDVGPGRLLLFIATTLVSGPLGEELGWRGYGLERAAARYGPRVAAVLMAAAWSLWHLPAFLIPGLQQLIFPTGLSFLEFASFTMSSGIMMAWLTFRAKGALGPAVLFHLCLLMMLLAVSERPPATLVWPTSAVFAALALLVLIREPRLGYRAFDPD
ncbi:CPBP family intramembrane glutamic endopeptidase [Sphingosinithalassobacter sp. CS137]|uniref:CPBP family intramembrane glutamic endopeptidase n=1 Tax=Sphingosinithalassobacter sp. CS137 TaxID=2762748 RepID=UPI00165EA260|nr:CPBP family intramembrane glutamic endopeptidase [Sphingosinithalassobacter sp. CS137]